MLNDLDMSERGGHQVAKASQLMKKGCQPLIEILSCPLSVACRSHACHPAQDLLPDRVPGHGADCSAASA